MLNSLTGTRTAGDIIGSAISFCRSNLPLLFRMLLVPTIFELIGKIMILLPARTISQMAGAAGRTSGFWHDGGSLVTVLNSMCLISLGLIICFVSEFLMFLRLFALVRVQAWHDEDYKEADKALWKKKWKLLATYSLFYTALIFIITFWGVIIAISAALLSKPLFGILIPALTLFVGIVGLIASTLICLACSCMMNLAVACDDRPLAEVYKSGIELSFAHLPRWFFFLLIVIIVVYALASILNLPPEVLGMIVVFTNLKSQINAIGHMHMHAPLYMDILAQIWVSLTHMITLPIILLSCGFFYLDLKVQDDGVDLIKRIERLADSNSN